MAETLEYTTMMVTCPECNHKQSVDIIIEYDNSDSEGNIFDIVIGQSCKKCEYDFVIEDTY